MSLKNQGTTVSIKKKQTTENVKEPTNVIKELSPKESTSIIKELPPKSGSQNLDEGKNEETILPSEISPETKVIYNCGKCNKSFNELKVLKHHQQTSCTNLKPKEQIQEQNSDINTAPKSLMDVSGGVTMSKGSFQCDNCNKTFPKTEDHTIFEDSLLCISCYGLKILSKRSKRFSGSKPIQMPIKTFRTEGNLSLIHI